MAEIDAPPGLRERKKAQTKQALNDAAQRLFSERGFDRTTVTEIAELAGVSERTFFRYFESKESLLLPDLESLFVQVETELARRPLEEPPMVAVREALMATAESPIIRQLIGLAHPVDDVRALVTSQLGQSFMAFEERFSRSVAARLPQDPDTELRARVIAGASLAAVRALVRTVRRHRAEAYYPPGAFRHLLPEAFDMLAESAVAVRPAGERQGDA